MASVNQDNQDPNQQTPAGGPVSISGTAGASASAGQGGGASAGVAAPGAASPVSTQQPQTNQGYTDVGSYLDANQAGATQMGNQVAGNLTNTYNNTKSGIDTSGNDFINNVNQGYTPAQDTSGMLANAVQTASDPTQTAAFQKQLNDSYTGPSSYSDYGTQQGNVAQAQQYGNLMNTPGGTNVLAQGLEGPQASQGVNQLDTMLLNGSPGAAQAMQTAAAPYAGLNSYLDQYNTQGNTAIAANTAAANAASQSAQGNLANTVSQFNTGLTNNLGTAQTANDAYNKSISDLRNGLAGGSLSGLPGVDPNLSSFYSSTVAPQLLKSSNYMAAGPANYLNASPTNMNAAAPTLAGTASQGDYATRDALSALAGNAIQSPLMGSYNAANAYQPGAPLGSADNRAIAGDMLNQLKTQQFIGSPNSTMSAQDPRAVSLDSLQRYIDTGKLN